MPSSNSYTELLAQKDRLRLEFIHRTSYGSLFQISVAVILVFLIDPWPIFTFWPSVFLIGLAISQSIRYAVFLSLRTKPQKLLDKRLLFLFFSYVTAGFWGIGSALYLYESGTAGLGLAFLLASVAVIAALTYSGAPDVFFQRFYIIFIFLPLEYVVYLKLGPEDRFLSTIFFAVFVLYCLYIGHKQSESLQLIYKQQDRIREDLSAARDIQRTLLPESRQRIGEFEIDVLYSPCEDLSGDFFEIQRLDHSVLFYVADVTSHGTAAAQVTYLLKGLFRNALPKEGQPIVVSELVQNLAREYVGFELKYAVGLFLGKLDLKTGGLEYVVSAFPDPIHVKEGQTAVISGTVNPMIDALTPKEKLTFESQTGQINQGENFYIFTDGAFEFLEAKSKRPFGYRNLRKALSQLPPEDWQNTLIANFKSAKASDQFEDDLTVFKIHRHL
jgi:serine phosphatase RsbU (regulator of sigma subunit)